MKLQITPKLFFIPLGVATLIMGFACSNLATEDATNEESSADFTLSSGQGSSVGMGESIQINASGGAAPYTYAVTNGPGTVAPSSTSYVVYTAPASISNATNVATVTAYDANGDSRNFPITITQSSQLFQLSPSSVQVNEAVAITPVTPLGHTYQFAIAQGSGSMNSNVYTTASFVETAKIQVEDLTAGTVSTVIISTGSNISSSSLGNAINAIAMTTLGSHVPGGGGCNGSYTQVGQVVDGASGYLYGDQIFCANGVTASGSTTVLTNFEISQSTTCPSGWSQIGSVENCQAGYNCGSTQAVCTQSGTYSSTSSRVSDLYITAEGQRDLTAPGCLAGYSRMGQVADCYNGTCYGLQSVCVAY